MTPEKRSASQPWTILSALQWTAGYFADKKIDQPRPAAEILLAHVLGCQRIDLYLRYDQPLNQDERARYRHMIQRRVKGEPVAYITGVREFWSLNFAVSPDVLIPRPETERLVELILQHHPADTPLRVLDLGTGSGAISVALASERPGWTIWASDVSSRALKMAKTNAVRNGCADAIRFFAGDWTDPIDSTAGAFDLIVSNPPYIAQADLDRLAPEVRCFEPRQALDGGPSGTRYIRHLIHRMPDHLRSGGRLYLEIGYDQADATETIAKNCEVPWSVTIHQDYGNRDRVVQLQLD